MEVFHGITKPGNPEIKYYYPTSVLVTGQDIIFFWVARMIMAGMEYEKKEPFEHVYFTGMVRDKQGRKMSKSLGNSPDLLHLIDRFGADAVRFGIMIAAPAGNDLLFDESSCDQGRSFNNKLWNALKLVRDVLPANGIANFDMSEQEFNRQSFPVQWFGARLEEAKAQIANLYQDFKISEALKTIYSLIWDDFCSWYLEWIKPGYGISIWSYVHDHTLHFFEQLLELLHPFMPFVTEEIYHQLRERKEGDDLIIRQYQQQDELNFFKTPYTSAADVLQLGEQLKAGITAIRDARIKNNLKPKDGISLYVQTSNADFSMIENVLGKSVFVEGIKHTTETIPNAITVVAGKDKFFIVSEASVDTTVQKEQLEKEMEYLKGFLQSVEKKLSNERFVQNAKPDVVETERRKKADAEQKIRSLEESLNALT
jgi:valyl-tRNA synthetase